MILTWSSDNGYVWQNLTGYRAVAIHYLNLTQLYPQEVRFCPGFCRLAVFVLVNLWCHVRIEIPYPALFPCKSHPNPIKTRNPAPARTCNSSFPTLLSAQIPNITAKEAKSRIPPNRQTYWGGDLHDGVIWLQLPESVTFSVSYANQGNCY